MSVYSRYEKAPAVECKYCHFYPLYWDQPDAAPDTTVKRKWKLMTYFGKHHLCKAFMKS